MKVLYFFIASLACVAAIAAQWLGQPRWMALLALAVAGLCLVLGLLRSQPGMSRKRIDWDDEKQAEIERLLANNQYGTAISQIKLWFPHTSDGEAKTVVEFIQKTGKYPS
ncbi:hypothetical protein CPHO_03220 [Corynebacterium phocae]|uniref:Uncharacterized protein n=1 Tax=Corynebacterium phocae TaxID=161895 RepID=A0A1L7D655_9CORY|nr:hypothetical protein [Corynebacterium phocae]APT93629.1 hypothetical protein CPHO_03220 [Corynebacterium phocae]KAA8726449.1 hypothetical protein F4V58_02765 [Corynebacterium phocae]